MANKGKLFTVLVLVMASKLSSVLSKAVTMETLRRVSPSAAAVIAFRACGQREGEGDTPRRH